MNSEIQILSELYRFLIDNTDNEKIVWFSDEVYDERFWRNNGGPIYSALFVGGPRAALLGIGYKRYYTRDPIFSNVCIRPIIEPAIGYQENRLRQKFEVCIGERPDTERKIEVRGFRGVVSLLFLSFYDEYDIVDDKIRKHRERIDGLDRYLYNQDHVVDDRPTEFVVHNDRY